MLPMRQVRGAKKVPTALAEVTTISHLWPMDAEMTNAQHGMIMMLLDKKRISLKKASKIIEMLLEEADVNSDELHNKQK